MAFASSVDWVFSLLLYTIPNLPSAVTEIRHTEASPAKGGTDSETHMRPAHSNLHLLAASSEISIGAQQAAAARKALTRAVDANF